MSTYLELSVIFDTHPAHSMPRLRFTSAVGRLLPLLCGCASGARVLADRRWCLATAAAVGAAPPATAEARSFQSADGAFGFRLPSAWKIAERCSPGGRAQCELFDRREAVLAYRSGGEAVLEADVDLGAFGTQLADFGTLDEVARGLLASLPATAELADARTELSRSGGPPCFYVLRFVGARGSERSVKLGVRQSRLYALHVQTSGAPSAALRAELEGLAATYQVFPVSSMRGGLLSSSAPALLRPPSQLPPLGAPPTAEIAPPTPRLAAAGHPTAWLPGAGATSAGATSAPRAPPPAMCFAADAAEDGRGGDGGGGDGGGGDERRRARATRRQKMRFDEAADVAPRLAEAGTDRRGGWRATKAKANRRNRRYEKRLLSGAAEALEAVDLGRD